MPVHDEAGGELWVEISALGREEDASPGVVLDEVDDGLGSRARSESSGADLNCGEVPSGGEAVVAIGKEERHLGDGGLQFSDASWMGDGPDLVRQPKRSGAWRGGGVVTAGRATLLHQSQRLPGSVSARWMVSEQARTRSGDVSSCG